MIHLLKKCGQQSPNCFTLVTLNQPDQPLIFVNSVFQEMTQYSEAEILGRNCRFLQGSMSNRQTIKEIRDGVASRQIVCEDLLNYKKDGTQFWNRLVLLPFESKGELYYFGFQHDVTESKRKYELALLDSFKPDINKADVTHWINNQLHLILMSLQILEKRENLKVIDRIQYSLQLISEYVQSLKI